MCAVCGIKGPRERDYAPASGIWVPEWRIVVSRRAGIFGENAGWPPVFGILRVYLIALTGVPQITNASLKDKAPLKGD